MPRPRPLLLVILDGFGHNARVEGNAIAMARKPTWDRLTAEYAHTLIHTSGPYVGLPEGQMGNSEVGHLNIGAGRIVHMESTRLDLMIENGTFFHQPLLLQAMERGRQRQLHMLGLVSDGGVHSQQEHLHALLRMAAQQKVERVFVHAFLDGRDTPPESGAGFLEALEQQMRNLGVGRIASVCGRYYAMDRDKRWERIERAYRAMVVGDARRVEQAVPAVRASYEHGVTDEFMEPVVVGPAATIRDHDAVIFFNFRADRARQTTSALAGLTALPAQSPVRQDLFIVTMTQYDKTFTAPFVLDKQSPAHILANVFDAEGLKNARIAETEKYAHVTYFFNGGNEKPYTGEERIMVPSPKVATYDLMPEMSAAGIADTVVREVERGAFDVYVINFANADMVGHSGKIPPTIRAVETVDACLGRIYAAVRQNGGIMMVTADHGNAELMIDPVTGGPHTYHTTNPVPLVMVTQGRTALRNDGSLRDIAPTLLALLGLPQPPEMTGKDLRL